MATSFSRSQSWADVNVPLAYFRTVPFRSHKSRRFFATPEYLRLRDLGAYAIQSPHGAARKAFITRMGKVDDIVRSPLGS